VNKKNSITTLSYFVKRLRDSSFIVLKMFDQYGPHDPRKWSIMIDPGGQSLLVTCYENKEFVGDEYFELNDGGNKFPKNFNLKTKSMEIIITTLIEKKIPQKTEDSIFVKDS